MSAEEVIIQELTKCTTMEDLNKIFNSMRTTLNKQYLQQKSRILDSAPKFKSIPKIQVNSIEVQEKPTNVALPVIEGERKDNEFKITERGVIL